MAADQLAALRTAVAAAEPAFLADLARLVNIDCGSYTKAGVDEVARWTAGLRGPGAPSSRIPTTLGSARRWSGRSKAPTPTGRTLLCIGHMDTVFDPGTAAERPFTIDATASRTDRASPT